MCKLKFKLYIKPTYNGSYLITTSNHPPHIFRNIPKSLLLRIRKICTSFIDYLYFSGKVVLTLCNKGYDNKYLNSLKYRIGQENRSILLPYKDKTTKKLNSNLVKTFFDHDNNFVMIKDLFLKSFFELTRIYGWMSDLEPFFIYKIKPNLSYLCVHLMSFNYNLQTCRTISCSKNCKICMYINTDFYISLDGFILPMLSNATCDSCNLVYIIVCLRCKVFYIGETSKSLNVRISQHLNGIKRFIPYLNIENEVAQHFRKIGHIIQHDFRVSVFKDKLEDTTIRRSVEMDLIFLFKNVFNYAILNSKINNLQNLNKLCFL